MNISLNSNNSLSPLLSAWERNQPSSSAAAATAAPETGDMVHVRPQPRPEARLLDDSEVDAVLQSTVDMIGGDIFGAMSAHSGLDAGRVAALLA